MPDASQQTSSDSITPSQDSQYRVTSQERRLRSMEVEQPPLASAAWSPISSPKLRSHLSEESSNSVGSSLDTASASAHLERYDIPWTSHDVNGIYRGAGPRRSRSYTAFLEWNAMNPVVRPLKSIRPLGGASRRRLIRQIQQLTKDKADLQAQLAVMASGNPSSIKLHASKVVEYSSAAQKKSDSSVDGKDSIDGHDGIERQPSDHHSSYGLLINTNNQNNNYPQIDGLQLRAQNADSSET